MQAKKLGWAVLSAVCVLAVLALFSGLLKRHVEGEAAADYGLAPLEKVEIGEQPGEVRFKLAAF